LLQLGCSTRHCYLRVLIRSCSYEVLIRYLNILFRADRAGSFADDALEGSIECCLRLVTEPHCKLGSCSPFTQLCFCIVHPPTREVSNRCLPYKFGEP